MQMHACRACVRPSRRGPGTGCGGSRPHSQGLASDVSTAAPEQVTVVWERLRALPSGVPPPGIPGTHREVGERFGFFSLDSRLRFWVAFSADAWKMASEGSEGGWAGAGRSCPAFLPFLLAPGLLDVSTKSQSPRAGRDGKDSGAISDQMGVDSPSWHSLWSRALIGSLRTGTGSDQHRCQRP